MVRDLLFHCWRYSRLLCLGLALAYAADAHAEACDTVKRKVTCYVKDSTGYVLEIHRYKNGLRSGDWETFNRRGELIKRLYYRKDELRWTFFYKNGEIIKSIDPKGRIREFSDCGCG